MSRTLRTSRARTNQGEVERQTPASVGSPEPGSRSCHRNERAPRPAPPLGGFSDHVVAKAILYRLNQGKAYKSTCLNDKGPFVVSKIEPTLAEMPCLNVLHCWQLSFTDIKDYMCMYVRQTSMLGSKTRGDVKGTQARHTACSLWA